MRELHDIGAVQAQAPDLAGYVIQDVDLSETSIAWDDTDLRGTIFLGCTFVDSTLAGRLVERGAMVFPRFAGLPYEPYRSVLYTPTELHEPFDAHRTTDLAIYEHFSASRGQVVDIAEALAQRIHDHAIDDALEECIAGEKVVGIMGGHSTPRDDPYFAKVAHLARALTRAGYFVATGGGPGIMEAGNLGAYMAAHEDEALDLALATLATAPRYTHRRHHETAASVVERYPDGAASVAIPTWFYGHEPSNLFGRYIAKYFSNSIREDGLLAISTHGVVFAPGSAGTTQEIFMDAAQNHYRTYDAISPMVFLGVEHYGPRTGLWSTMQRLACGHEYGRYLHLTDAPLDALAFIERMPPKESVELG